MAKQPQTRATLFEAALAAFATSVQTAKDAAADCARIALEEFQASGNLVFCQRFYDAMPVNFTRKSAFRTWLVKVAPVKVEGGKFVKDMSRKDMKIEVEAATKVPFWDAEPAPREPKEYGVADIPDMLEAVIVRLKNTKQFKAANKAALIRLNQAEKAISDLRKEAYPTELENEPVEEPAADESQAEKTGAVEVAA